MPASVMSETDRLSPISSRFVLHWGEMGSRWGVNRSVAQIHALLLLCLTRYQIVSIIA